jgi:hypothetical protein
MFIPPIVQDIWFPILDNGNPFSVIGAPDDTLAVSKGSQKVVLLKRLSEQKLKHIPGYVLCLGDWAETLN